MVRIIRFFLIMFAMANLSHAATRSDINVIEAAENIRYLSQKIAKNYLYLYSRPKQTKTKNKIYDMLKELSSSFVTIASSTNDSYTKDLLKYLEYNKEGIEAILEKKVSKDASYEMLDYSEILLEGGESIAKAHDYEFNKEETMLMNIKKYEYLIERLGKFYMASRLGALSQANKKKINKSKKIIDEGLRSIKSYHYPEELESKKKDLELFWSTNARMMSHSYDMFVPNLMNITSERLEQSLTLFALHHSKRQ